METLLRLGRPHDLDDVSKVVSTKALFFPDFRPSALSGSHYPSQFMSVEGALFIFRS